MNGHWLHAKEVDNPFYNPVLECPPKNVVQTWKVVTQRTAQRFKDRSYLFLCPPKVLDQGKEGGGGDRGREGEGQGKGKDEIQCHKRNSNPCGVQG